jgi:hypothetical protein
MAPWHLQFPGAALLGRSRRPLPSSSEHVPGGTGQGDQGEGSKTCLCLPRESGTEADPKNPGEEWRENWEMLVERIKFWGKMIFDTFHTWIYYRDVVHAGTVKDGRFLCVQQMSCRFWVAEMITGQQHPRSLYI